MRKLPAIIAAALLSIQPISQAHADDELNTLINLLAMNVASIKVTSDNCKIDEDPMLEGRIIEVLVQVPGLHMSDVISSFARRHQLEAHSRGSKCYPEDVDHLKTLNNIYEMSVADLRKLVEGELGE